MTDYRAVTQDDWNEATARIAALESALEAALPVIETHVPRQSTSGNMLSLRDRVLAALGRTAPETSASPSCPPCQLELGGKRCDGCGYAAGTKPSPMPLTHWSKDPLIPYSDCECSSCREARTPIETAVSDGTAQNRGNEHG